MVSKPWMWVIALTAMVGLAVAYLLIGHDIYTFSTSARQDIDGTPVPVWLAVTGAVVAPIGVIATAIGVVAALAVAIRDTKRYRVEREQRHAEESARRADQARLIQVTLELQELGDNISGVKITSVHICVTNHSDRPILDVSPCSNAFKDQLTNAEPVNLTPVQEQMLHPATSKKWAYKVAPVNEPAPKKNAPQMDELVSKPDIHDPMDESHRRVRRLTDLRTPQFA